MRSNQRRSFITHFRYAVFALLKGLLERGDLLGNPFLFVIGNRAEGDQIVCDGTEHGLKIDHTDGFDDRTRRFRQWKSLCMKDLGIKSMASTRGVRASSKTVSKAGQTPFAEDIEFLFLPFPTERG